MNDQQQIGIPEKYTEVLERANKIGFTMPSDFQVGSLLKTLVSSRPAAHILELGTGAGLSLVWMIDGLDDQSTLISVDNDAQLSKSVLESLGEDTRVTIVCEDGTQWLKSYTGKPFDLIFADAWPGKYSKLNEVLELLKVGGFYVIDDMEPQENWPEGHEKLANNLAQYLEERSDMTITKMKWSTGIIIAVKNK